MKPHQIEPGLLKVFRLYAIIQWGLIALAFCGESLDEQQSVQPITFFTLIQASLLAWLLVWKRAERLVGRWFLPSTLTIASAGPVVSIAAATAIRIDQGITGAEAWASPGGLILWLIVPLLLVSSQYRTRVMLSFGIGTAILELVLALWLDAAGGPPLRIVLEQAVIRVMLFSVVGYVIVRLSTAQRDQREALSQKNAQLSHYATTLEQLAISRERNRVARELHDTLAHTLSAASVQLQALGVLLDTDLNAAHDHLKLTQEMMRSGLQEARRALRALRVSPLDDLGLGLALRQLAESTAARGGLRLDLHVPEQIEGLAADIEQHVYRIAEEALTNVVRHANASELAIRVQQNGATLSMTISDNGAGFDVRQMEHDGHYGMMGMQERAALCGGTLAIQSQPQQGTTLLFRIEGSG